MNVCCTGFSRKLTRTIPPKGGTTNGAHKNSQPLRDLYVARKAERRRRLTSNISNAELMDLGKRKDRGAINDYKESLLPLAP